MTPVRPPVYLDYQSTTPVDPRVLEAMLPYFSEHFGNPHSAHHSFGRQAAEAVEAARGSVAALIGARRGEITFTSGATEANNLALRGVASFLKREGKNHIISTPIEHTCVLEVLDLLKLDGFSVTTVDVGSDGLVSVDVLARCIRPQTGLVTVMMANNEIGVVQPLGEIGSLCARHGILFHTDAAQAVGKVPIDVERMHIALLSLSGHKLYAPKGIGALYVRRHPRVRVNPLQVGGGQEQGLRSGTLPVPLCVGLGVACEVAAKEMSLENEKLLQLRDQLLTQLRAECGSISLNGSLENRLAGNVNVSFEGVDAEVLVKEVRDQVAISTGSACTSEKLESSHVLRAIGLPNDQAESAVRIGLGRFTSPDDVTFATRTIGKVVRSNRRMYRDVASAEER